MRQKGFSLPELLISLAVLTMIMVGFLSMFDTSVRLTKAQSSLAEGQESLRYTVAQLVRATRMAGAGGIPLFVPDRTVTPQSPGQMAALRVYNNVSATPSALLGFHEVVAGTDVLELRGAFADAQVFDLHNRQADGAYTYSSGTNAGTVTIPALSLDGESQSIAGLDARIDASQSPPLWAPAVFFGFSTERVNIGPTRYRQFAQYGVACLVDKNGTREYVFSTAGATSSQIEYLLLNGGAFLPALNALDMVTRVSVVDNWRFFIGPDERDVPTLYQYDVASDMAFPISADIVDLQVSLGCDVRLDGNPVYTGAAADDDEWIYNAVGDLDTLDASQRVTGAPGKLLWHLTDVRITLVNRVAAPDTSYRQPPNGVGNRTGEFCFEDGRNLLDDSAAGLSGSKFRHRFMTDQVKLRSVGALREGV